MEANSTGGQGSSRAVAPSDNDEVVNEELKKALVLQVRLIEYPINSRKNLSFYPFYSLCIFMYSVFMSVSLHHTTQTSMLPARLEPTNPASDRRHTHALDRSVTGIDRIETSTFRLVAVRNQMLERRAKIADGRGAAFDPNTDENHQRVKVIAFRGGW